MQPVVLTDRGSLGVSENQNSGNYTASGNSESFFKINPSNNSVLGGMSNPRMSMKERIKSDLDEQIVTE